MNKKLLAILAVFALFATAGTATLLEYYGQASVDVDVKQAISLSGDESIATEIVACDFIKRSHTAENESIAEIPVIISTLVSADWTPNSSAEANTVHKGTLELVKKVVDFEATHWDIVEGTEINVEYVMIGSSFDAEVTSGAEAGYEIIYYKDNSDRFSSPAQAIKLADVGSDLPYTDDKNLEDYDYCAEEENYTTCHGAKLWYVPSDAILAGNELDWSRANEFYFEKEELIQYNTTGAITMFPSEVLDFTTETTFDCASISGEYNILTQIATITA